MNEGEKENRVADRPHNWTLSLSTGAIIVSLLSATISIVSVRIAYLQYVIAVAARDDSRKAAEKRAADEERARKAAESLAEATLSGLQLSIEQFHMHNRPWLEVSGVTEETVLPAMKIAILNRGTIQTRNSHADCFVITHVLRKGRPPQLRRQGVGLLPLDDLLPQASGSLSVPSSLLRWTQYPSPGSYSNPFEDRNYASGTFDCRVHYEGFFKDKHVLAFSVNLKPEGHPIELASQHTD